MSGLSVWKVHLVLYAGIPRDLEKARTTAININNFTLPQQTNHNSNIPETSSALVEKIIKVYKRPHKNHHNIADRKKIF